MKNFTTQQEKDFYEDLKTVVKLMAASPEQPNLEELAIHYHCMRVVAIRIKEKYSIQDEQ